MKNALSIAVCFLCVALFGCATKSPMYHDIASRMPPLQPGNARLYLYSMEHPDLAHQQEYTFYVDGKKIGHVTEGECLYVDHPAGSCEVKATAGVSNPFAGSAHLPLNLVAGETRYVQVGMKSSFFVKIRLIIADPDQARPDLEKCKYVGAPLASN